MNGILIAILQVSSRAEMAAADMAIAKMAAVPGPGALHANSMLVEAVVSPRNQNIIWFSYGFASALVVVSLYFFFLVRQRPDIAEKKRSLIIGAALFAVALLLWILPARFFPIPLPPQNFDMRTT